MISCRKLIFAALAFLSALTLGAQTKKSEPIDSLVSLLSAQSMELIEKDGVDYRKVTGPARFLHNNTYLICDTALWNTAEQTIYAIGHVKILQEQTVLTSDSLTYLINSDLARFRGSVVQLQDKDRNTLRTRHLDYNTKDSVATFDNGGAMRDKDGQIIESTRGSYDAKIKKFSFTYDVNMFTDSIFVKTERLEYDTPASLATFRSKTDVWQDDNMMTANTGWFDRNRDLFFFRGNVHGLTPEREGWADSLYFNRATNDIDMLGNVQLVDTVKNAGALAGRIEYTDSLSLLKMSRDPAIIIVTKDGEKRDTLYGGADTLYYQTLMKFQIDPSEFDLAQKRLDDMAADAVTAYRQKAAEEARKAAEEAKKNDPEYQAQQKAEETRRQASGEASEENAEEASEENTEEAPGENPEVVPPPRDTTAAGSSIGDVSPADTLSAVTDSVPTALRGESAAMAKADSMSIPGRDTLMTAKADSLSIPGRDSLLIAGTDSLAVADSLSTAPKDSTKLGFAWGVHNVKVFRKDLQMACDSLRYNDIDSLVRLYKSPLVWNDGNRQYASDSIYVAFKDNHADKAYLMANAFISVEEQKDCYDQIRSTEMLAYFDTTSALRRFDALGEVNAIFYLKEDSTFATVNKSEAKMLYALMKNNNLESVSYFDQAKNDAYPLAQMKTADRLLKGFNWAPDKKPAGPQDITSYSMRPSERLAYESHPRAVYKQTDIYFPGYMKGVYKKIEESKARKARENAERQRRQDSIATVQSDSLAALSDSLHVPADSLGAASDSLAASADSLSAVPDLSVSAADSVEVAADSVVTAEKKIDPKELARRKKAEEKAAKLAAKEARWARLDSLDAAKAAAKVERKLQKQRARKAKILITRQKQEEKDNARLEKYRQKFEKRKVREAERALRKKQDREGIKKEPPTEIPREVRDSLGIKPVPISDQTSL